jgi:hypothetical protein
MKPRIRMASSRSGAFAKRWFLGEKIENEKRRVMGRNCYLKKNVFEFSALYHSTFSNFCTYA